MDAFGELCAGQEPDIFHLKWGFLRWDKIDFPILKKRFTLQYLGRGHACMKEFFRAYPEMIRTQLAGIFSVMLRRFPLKSTKDSCGKSASPDEKSDGAIYARLIMGLALNQHSFCLLFVLRLFIHRQRTKARYLLSKG